MPDEPNPLAADLWRLDTPPHAAAESVAALTPADFADCLVLFKLTPGKDRVSLCVTDGTGPLARLGLTLPEGTAEVIRLLLLRTLHDVAAVANGEKYVV